MNLLGGRKCVEFDEPAKSPARPPSPRRARHGRSPDQLPMADDVEMPAVLLGCSAAGISSSMSGAISLSPARVLPVVDRQEAEERVLPMQSSQSIALATPSGPGDGKVVQRRLDYEPVSSLATVPTVPMMAGGGTKLLSASASLHEVAAYLCGGAHTFDHALNRWLSEGDEMLPNVHSSGGSRGGCAQFVLLMLARQAL
eukprot:CAMPEP_0181255144 /NCGR_PEP_ID=MMETSP1096-20121128/48990_1 /TAXON_ID=156174 ORGANISM="Chrysochromulina ericina, Strain CCMP281" /NCGR_SAMPLE_ID=MMETSP1096 /ASSEMBLY_ACC=CAM_ASM_000453 /LENGTH=198 /DNA_ID=CAMNT_0023353247 /DNA_START=14 /DNA_END=612 /DNA_ORIENTATION=+